MTFEKVATCNIPTSEWAALKWLRRGSGFWTALKESKLGEKATNAPLYNWQKELSRQKWSLSWQGKSKKGLELDSLKPSSTSIQPCACQNRLRSCLKCLAWVPPLSCYICHFSRNCFNTNRVPRLYEKQLT